MHNIYSKLSLAFAGGVVGGVVQSLIIVALSEFAFFQLIGTDFKVLLNLPYLYQRATWGGLWGLLFVIPILTGWHHRQRGLVFAAGPAAASFLYFLPILDHKGWFGLGVGLVWPVVVIVFALIWGFVAGAWLDRAYGLVKDEA
jgi:hypothetical protein